MAKIKSGDDVIVIAGKDKGKRGTIKSVLGNNKLLIEGVNVAKKHQKGNPNQGIPGGIIDKEMPIHRSNVALFDASTGSAARVGYRMTDEGKKVRYFKQSGETVDV